MIVQIYGVTTPADAAAVAALAPDHVGVVVDEGIDTWDSVDETTATAIVGHLAGLRGLNAVAGLRGPNAVAGLRGPNAVAGLRGPNAVAGLRGPNAVAGLRGPNAVAGLRGPNAVAGLRGPNAVAGLRGPNAVAGLRGPNAVVGIRVVALSLSHDRARIERTVEILRPDVLHLARVAEHLTPAEVAALRRSIAPIELMVTVPVRGDESVDLARGFQGSADYLLLDTADPASGVVGATGHVHDWSVSAAIVSAVDLPVVLAGGLGPHNVAEAIERVRPAGVDSETHTSQEDNRRRKDPEKVRRFIEIARTCG